MADPITNITTASSGASVSNFAANQPNQGLTDLKAKMGFMMNAVQAAAAVQGALSRNPDYVSGGFDLPLASRLIRFTVHKENGYSILPAVILPVNPKQLKVAHKKRSSYRYTLGGFVLDHWHDDITTITANGYIPALKSKAKILASSYWVFLFFLNLYKSCGQVAGYDKLFFNVPSLGKQELTGGAIASNGTLLGAKPGTSDIQAYSQYKNTQDASGTQLQNFETAPGMPTLDSNGNVKLAANDTVLMTRSEIINAEIDLAYQSDIYTGIFTDFTVDEDEEVPNSLLYSFTFTARKHTDLMASGLNAAAESYAKA